MTRPTLILLCGIPGSGKTYYAKKYISKHDNTIHLSSDSIRKELYGDESIQGNPMDIFGLMQNRTVDALNDGQSVVYDATNITRKDRAGIISMCPKFVQIECHIIWAPIEECIARDAVRERIVGRVIIDRMLKRFQFPYYDEGIDMIKIVTSEDFDYDKYYDNVIVSMRIPHDNPHHTLDIYNHCQIAAKYATERGFSPSIYVAAKFHDCGKPYVKSFVNSKGETVDTAHYYQHQCISAWIACGVTSNIDVLWLISTHMDMFGNTKYYNRLPTYLKTAVDKLHECDAMAH